MITSNGKVLQYHGKKFCVTCEEVRDHTCFHMAYRKSECSDDAYRKEERWNCDRCHIDKVIVKEIPIPTEKTMLVKLLMSLNEKYELDSATISVDYREVRAVFRFPEHDLPKLRAIAENWADRGYITAKDLLKLEKAGMRDVAKIPPRWAPTKRQLRAEAMRNAFN
jgi:hypothetical protein